MADKEISDLTVASALAGTELVHVDQGGNSRQTTAQDIADLAAGAISAVDSATVATDETRALTSYGDLATAGPAVTLTTGAEVIVTISCSAYRTGGTGSAALAAVDVSGATTLAAADGNGIVSTAGVSNHIQTPCRRFKITGLTPGSNTFTVKYRCDAVQTHHFYNRDITVEAL